MPTLLRDIFLNHPAPLLWGVTAVAVLLVLGALAAALMPRLKPGADHRNLQQRVASWWVMAALLVAGLLLGWQAMIALFAVVSFIALREFLSLSPLDRADRLIVLVAYLTIPLCYGLVAANQYGKYLVAVPVYAFLILPFLMACAGQTERYLARAAVVHWGVVTCVFNLGFIPFLMMVPAWEAPQAGAAGMVFLLLLATELNDVAQYCWGKAIGRLNILGKIMPRVSPNKTWEGFLGGWATTAAVILVLGPIFTPLHGIGLWTVALLLPPTGFAGDVTMSAIKRDLGVKDTSALIPGHGGVLDRIDSLTFTAPLYFHLMAFFALDRF